VTRILPIHVRLTDLLTGPFTGNTLHLRYTVYFRHTVYSVCPIYRSVMHGGQTDKRPRRICVIT